MLKKRHRNNMAFRFIAEHHIAGHLLLCFGSVFMLFPFAWLLFSSFKPTPEIFTLEFRLLPTTWTFEHYVTGWNSNPQYSYFHFLANTLYLTFSVITGTVISSSLTAFAFARLKFKFSGVMFGLMMSTMMLPSQVTMIPQYLIFRDFQWVNTYLPFIIPAFLATNAFNVFLLIQFIRGIPRELDESARIDGCNTFRIYYNIVLPLTKPALFSVVIFTFLGTWDNFMGQLIYISNVRQYTIALVLRNLVDTTNVVSWGPMLAMTFISMMPCILLFFFAQDYFVDGIATTGLKG